MASIADMTCISHGGNGLVVLRELVQPASADGQALASGGWWCSMLQLGHNIDIMWLEDVLKMAGGG